MTERLSLHFMYLLHCFDVLMAISSGYYISEHSIGYNGHLTKKKKNNNNKRKENEKDTRKTIYFIADLLKLY